MSHENPWLNPAITQARRQALDLLRPTPAELEHGMELHARATVVDAYGFGCFAAEDGARLAHPGGPSPDPWALEHAMTESSMIRMVDDPRQRALFDEVWRAAGVTCVVKNSGEECNHLERLIERLAYNTYVTDSLPRIMMRATTADDVHRAKRAGKYCYLMTTNGVPLTGSGRGVADELRHVRLLAQLGVRMMHLTYNRRNLIGDGCVEARDGGLSDFGGDVVAELNRLGVIADVAHSSEKTCLDARFLFRRAHRRQSHHLCRVEPPLPGQIGRRVARHRRDRRAHGHLLHPCFPGWDRGRQCHARTRHARGQRLWRGSRRHRHRRRTDLAAKPRGQTDHGPAQFSTEFRGSLAGR